MTALASTSSMPSTDHLLQRCLIEQVRQTPFADMCHWAVSSSDETVLVSVLAFAWEYVFPALARNRHARVASAFSILEGHGLMTPELLGRIALFSEIRLAQSTPLSQEDFEAGLHHPHELVRAETVDNPSVDVAEYVHLEQDPDDRVRAAFARRAGRDSLVRMSKDPSVCVRIEVAENPLCPLQYRLLLAEDPCDVVRMSVATSIHTPEEHVLALCADPEVDVRNAAADHLAWRRRSVAAQ